MRECIICHKQFIPKRPWQKVCDDPECLKKRKQWNAWAWRRRNPEKKKEYNRAYAQN